MKTIQPHVDLAPMTSFKVGGLAEAFIKIKNVQDFERQLPKIARFKPLWLLGEGSNVLISDKGLPGLTLKFEGGEITYSPEDNLLIADSGVLWDDLVVDSIQRQLWGIELMSGIPGTVGGAAAININAYGQALSDSLRWVKIYNLQKGVVEKLPFQANQWSYKRSPYADGKAVILQIALKLSDKITCPIAYPTALQYAQEINLDPSELDSRRQIIIGTRGRAGSLLNETPVGRAKTCGSFFKNPLVGQSRLSEILQFDETGFKRQHLETMNRLHGGASNRLSAAHVLLAAGFYRGQTFGSVRLHPDHVLKIENYRHASASEIYQVARSIQSTVKMKLGINLEFEVSLMGEF